jgi:hypothetical protein
VDVAAEQGGDEPQALVIAGRCEHQAADAV